MTAPHHILPVKLISGIIYPKTQDIQTCLDALEKAFSAIDFRSAPVPFSMTEYYRPEMGSDLLRIWVSFRELVNPSSLIDAKWATHDIEEAFSEDGNRRVNLDPGYLDLFKVVLASFKARANKLYLNRDIWADWVAFFEKGRFHPFSWTFPDFQQGLYDAELMAIRNVYKEQLRTRERS